MDYEEFLEQADGFNMLNAKILKTGYNGCDVCFFFHIQIRELIGRIKERIVENDKPRDRNGIVMDYFALHHAFIVASAEDSMCSHLKRMIDIAGMEKTQAFKQARDMVAHGKEDA